MWMALTYMDDGKDRGRRARTLYALARKKQKSEMVEQWKDPSFREAAVGGVIAKWAAPGYREKHAKGLRSHYSSPSNRDRMRTRMLSPDTAARQLSALNAVWDLRRRYCREKGLPGWRFSYTEDFRNWRKKTNA